jgi:hypothetical protein
LRWDRDIERVKIVPPQALDVHGVSQTS